MMVATENQALGSEDERGEARGPAQRGIMRLEH